MTNEEKAKAKQARQQRYLSARASGMGISESCRAVGITRSCVARWRTRDRVFADVEAEMVDQMQRERTAKHYRSLRRAVRRGRGDG